MSVRLIAKAPRFRGTSEPPEREPWRAVHRAADREAPKLERAIVRWANLLGISANAVRRLLGTGDAERIANEALPWDKIEPALQIIVLGSVSDAFLGGARGSAGLGVVNLRPALERLNPEATRWAAVRSATFVTNITRSQRQVFRDIITRAQREGLSLTAQQDLILDRLRAGIGLDRVRAQSLANFERAQIEAGVAEDIVRARVSAQRERLLRDRARTIARHETVVAANKGKWELWREARRRGLIPPGTRKRRIVVTDGRQCPICDPMQGQTVALHENFVSPFDGSRTMSGAIHVRCRCDESLVFPEA